MDGYEVARQIRQIPELAKTLLVAFSGFGQPFDIRRCREAVIDFRFVKPVDLKIIKSVFTSWGQSRKANVDRGCEQVSDGAPTEVVPGNVGRD